ncbi:MAG: hypothetical protein EA398_04875 [Deltaproteobacteria bacterium]|nr:MAG: hypothetical protein EA398_04875 [Deltaproteobacteria bacterium]
MPKRPEERVVRVEEGDSPRGDGRHERTLRVARLLDVLNLARMGDGHGEEREDGQRGGEGGALRRHDHFSLQGWMRGVHAGRTGYTVSRGAGVVDRGRPGVNAHVGALPGNNSGGRIVPPPSVPGRTGWMTRMHSSVALPSSIARVSPVGAAAPLHRVWSPATMLDDATFSRIALSYSLLSPAALREVEELATLRKLPRVEVALQTGSVREEQLAQAVARSLNLAYRDLENEPPSTTWARRVPIRILRHHRVVPLGQASAPGTVLLGMVDPLDIDAQQEAGAHLKAAIEPVVVGRRALDAALATLNDPGHDAPRRSGAAQTTPGSHVGPLPRSSSADTRPGSARPVSPHQTVEMEQLDFVGDRHQTHTSRHQTTRNTRLPRAEDGGLADPLSLLVQRHDSDVLVQGLIEALVARRIVSIADIERAIEARRSGKK